MLMLIIFWDHKIIENSYKNILQANLHVGKLQTQIIVEYNIHIDFCWGALQAERDWSPSKIMEK